MKVLFTKRNYAPMGGSESLTYQWATRLAARGHDVRVVCGQAFDERPRFEDRGVDVIQVKPRGGFLGLHIGTKIMVVSPIAGVRDPDVAVCALHAERTFEALHRGDQLIFGDVQRKDLKIMELQVVRSWRKTLLHLDGRATESKQHKSE